jgi:class 3 adenylate cyclase
MAARNTAIPEDRRVEFRIGINVGDIIIDDGDIYGDGVNIAARVESLPAPERSAFPTMLTNRSKASSRSTSVIWVSKILKILRSLCAYMGCG